MRSTLVISLSLRKVLAYFNSRFAFILFMLSLGWDLDYYVTVAMEKFKTVFSSLRNQERGKMFLILSFSPVHIIEKIYYCLVLCPHLLFCNGGSPILHRVILSPICVVREMTTLQNASIVNIFTF